MIAADAIPLWKLYAWLLAAAGIAVAACWILGSMIREWQEELEDLRKQLEAAQERERFAVRRESHDWD